MTLGGFLFEGKAALVKVPREGLGPEARAAAALSLVAASAAFSQLRGDDVELHADIALLPDARVGNVAPVAFGIMMQVEGLGGPALVMERLEGSTLPEYLDQIRTYEVSERQRGRAAAAAAAAVPRNMHVITAR